MTVYLVIRPTKECHYTYITKFKPSQEELCEEHYTKTCQITMKSVVVNETVSECHQPVARTCTGEGPEECRTVYESSCNTRYLETKPGKYQADTECEKLPIRLCGQGCEYKEQEKECHDKVVASVLEIPEEVCDLNPQKMCHFTTKLVPKLEPLEECTQVMKETCHLSFSEPKRLKKPLITKWCLDESDEFKETERSGNSSLQTLVDLPDEITALEEKETVIEGVRNVSTNSETFQNKVHQKNAFIENNLFSILAKPGILDLIENDVEKDLEFDQNENQYSEKNVRIPNIQYLEATNDFPVIEAGTPSEFIGPKRRDLYSQLLFQTDFVQ